VKLHWQPGLSGKRLEAEAVTASGGRYHVMDCSINSSVYRRGERFGALFTPPQGRARMSKDGVVLGGGRTLAEAKALCEQHHAERRP
jgi:hypothetical protein